MKNEIYTATKKELDDQYNQLKLDEAECKKIYKKAKKEKRELRGDEREFIHQFMVGKFIYECI